MADTADKKKDKLTAKDVILGCLFLLVFGGASALFGGQEMLYKCCGKYVDAAVEDQESGSTGGLRHRKKVVYVTYSFQDEAGQTHRRRGQVDPGEWEKAAHDKVKVIYLPFAPAISSMNSERGNCGVVGLAIIALVGLLLVIGHFLPDPPEEDKAKPGERPTDAGHAGTTAPPVGGSPIERGSTSGADEGPGASTP
jgi:hypothetical protein